MKNLSLIIPAKYEKESLPKVLIELKKYKITTYIILEKKDIETVRCAKKFPVNIVYQKGKGYGDSKGFRPHWRKFRGRTRKEFRKVKRQIQKRKRKR